MGWTKADLLVVQSNKHGTVAVYAIVVQILEGAKYLLPSA